MNTSTTTTPTPSPTPTQGTRMDNNQQQVSCYDFTDRRTCLSKTTDRQDTSSSSFTSTQSPTSSSSSNTNGICTWECSKTIHGDDIDCRCVVFKSSASNEGVTTIVLGVFGFVLLMTLIFLIIRCFKKHKPTSEMLQEALKLTPEEMERRNIEEDFLRHLRIERKQRVDENLRRASTGTTASTVPMPALSPSIYQQLQQKQETTTTTVTPPRSADPARRVSLSKDGIPQISVTAPPPSPSASAPYRFGSAIHNDELEKFEAFKEKVEHDKKVKAAVSTAIIDGGGADGNDKPPVRIIRRPPGNFAIRIRCMSKEERRDSLEKGKARLNLRRRSIVGGQEGEYLTFEEEVELEKKRILEERNKKKKEEERRKNELNGGEPALAQFVPILRQIAENIRERTLAKKKDEQEKEAQKDHPQESPPKADDGNTSDVPPSSSISTAKSKFLKVPPNRLTDSLSL